MANWARVGRETIYAMQPPIQSTPLQSNTEQPNLSTSPQPTQHHQKGLATLKNSNRADSANNTHDDTIGPVDSDSRLAPSSIHPAAPSILPPSTTPPSNTNHSPQQHGTHPKQCGQPSHKMTQGDYIPPHLRWKTAGRNNRTPVGDAPTPEKSAATKSAEAEPPSAEVAHLAINPTHGQPQAPLSPPLSLEAQNQASQWEKPAPVLDAEAEMNAAWGYSAVPDAETKMNAAWGYSAVPDAEAEMNAAWGYVAPVPVPPSQPKKMRNNRCAPPQTSRPKWPKNRDMKAVTDDGDYNPEDNGWGPEYKSDSNGDPDYDIKKLVDWNGEWLPADPDWQNRNGYVNRHLRESVEKWIDGHDESCIDNFTHLLTSAQFKDLDNNELAPRTWVPAKIEGVPPQSFWEALPHRAPAALSDIDISERTPYWEEYLDDSEFLRPPQQPQDSILDPKDEENRKPGASKSAEQNLNTIANKNLAREKRRKQKLNRPIVISEPLPCAPGYRPTSNVYFRPVVATDAQGIQELYNYFVTNTISAPEFEPRSVKDIADRIRTITNEGLPYIVAVKKGLHQNGFNSKGPQNYVSESIVGMAFMDDFCDGASLYRFTFELEFYVHPDYTRQNIAKCMLDRLLEMVNTSYPAKGGYPWINNGDYLKHGAGRVVKMVNCYIPHDAEDDMGWMSEFMRKFKFRKAGHMFKMGHKFGKVVDVTVYQHETSETINANAPPQYPL